MSHQRTSTLAPTHRRVSAIALALITGALLAMSTACDARDASTPATPAARRDDTTKPSAPPPARSEDSGTPAAPPSGTNDAAKNAAKIPEKTAASDTAPATVSIFDRVGLIGASATAGFGVRVDALGADGVSREIHGADLGDVFRAACVRPATLSRYGTMFFFMDPIGTGRSEVDRVLRFKPTCVLAVDFLFWYGYGAVNAQGTPLRNEDERLALLEVGLAQLDRIVETGVPLVVGDFPDMHEAVGKMLSKEQMPATKTLEQLNARLAKWASTHPNVRVLHLSTLAPSLDRGDPIEIRGRVWSKKADGALLQSDRLHPTFAGAMAMLAKACELAEICATRDGGSAPVFTACDETMCFEPSKVTERFLAQVREGRRAKDKASTPKPPAEAPAGR